MDDLFILLGRWPSWAQMLSGLTLLVTAAIGVNFLLKRIILRMIDRGLERLGLKTGTAYFEPFARRLATVLPAIVISRGIVLVPHLSVDAITLIQNVAHAAIVFALTLALSAALDAINGFYQSRPQAGSRPIKGYVQVAKIILFGAAAILVVAVLMDQSPLLLLSSLGAMAAVLMLVFKDTILSLVASVQLTSNDMLRVGDWIEAPKFEADGDVVDIALHTVKVQNFDKTITTIPTHRLIAEPFRNWRGMKDAGARRIMRSLDVDQTSVRFLSSDDKVNLARFKQLADYIEDKQRELENWNDELSACGHDAVNYRKLTNIGTFRAYIEGYISDHPLLRKDMTKIVRQLSPGPEGLPIQIYCFAATVEWSRYEAIQADIFDHLLAILPQFGLQLYQRPGSSDFERRRITRAEPEPARSH
ncbi:mechanosensitive ion channel family protein [Novosphingobium sp. G106]|uniref:mechanosensitive ion channel family protein n=1 Tax=Novosphingobium sp. G106 TaxID=2849500 RepID=UPI001C2D426C|nr:mechanosensitive ion channel domain-containing protein [Novosphingobium sp. G106]MBV1691340.1 mechanosensitive ion channel family protein [Novosphingobium sp. G106]